MKDALDRLNLHIILAIRGRLRETRADPEGVGATKKVLAQRQKQK